MRNQGNSYIDYWTKQEYIYLQRLRENPVNAENHIAIAALYEVNHRYDDCMLHCNLALNLSTSNNEKAEANVLMGRIHKEKREYNSAIAHFLMALDYCPQHAIAMEDAGTCYLLCKDFTNAKYWLIKLEQIEEYEEYAWMQLADLYCETKDIDRAIHYYTKCIEIYPDNHEAICGKGRCLAVKKHFKESIALFSRAAELYPNDALAHYYLGVSYQKIKDQYRAMHHYTKALDLDPDFAEVYNNIAKLYADFDGDINMAIQYLEKALRNVENNRLQQVLYLNLARLYERIADYDRAGFYKNKQAEE